MRERKIANWKDRESDAEEVEYGSTLIARINYAGNKKVTLPFLPSFITEKTPSDYLSVLFLLYLSSLFYFFSVILLSFLFLSSLALFWFSFSFYMSLLKRQSFGMTPLFILLLLFLLCFSPCRVYVRWGKERSIYSRKLRLWTEVYFC